MVPAVGHTKMMAKLKERKGSTVWDHFTIDDLVYSIFLLKNHEDNWSRNFELKRMDLSEQEKYKKHKTLFTADERARYAPKNPRFNKKRKQVLEHIW